MIEMPGVPDPMRLPPAPPRPGEWKRPVIGLALLAITAAVILLFSFVVPAAGAAGGCGGG